jgi:glycosyltransferase involved in cell wall biosynthesis
MAGVPVVIHSPHGHVFYGYYGPTMTGLFIILERWAARLSDRIIVLTERGAEEHLKRGIGKPEQFVAIPSGVDIEGLRARLPSRVEARRQLGWPPDAPVVMGVGRLVPIKGFDLLVRAMPRILAWFGDARIVLVGDGLERRRLESLAGEAGVWRALSIVGASSEVAMYLAAADVLVAPSRNEGMGRVLVEAMTAGLPVVATRVGGIPAVVADGETGILIPAEDSEAVAKGVELLLRNPGLRQKFGHAARIRAEEFSLKRMAAKLLALYRETTREKGVLAEALSPP